MSLCPVGYREDHVRAHVDLEAGGHTVQVIAEDGSVATALPVNCAMKASLAETGPAVTVSHVTVSDVIVRYVTVPIARRMRIPSIDAR